MQLTKKAKDHHNKITRDRINALNNMQSSLFHESKQFIMFLLSCDIKSKSLKDFDKRVSDTVDVMTLELDEIKKDIQITSRCNHLYLQTNPILCEDDLRRYYDFMFMSYVTISRDITKICQNIDRVLTQLKKERRILRPLSNGCDQSITI